MKSVVYLDNSATSMPCQKAIDNINSALCENWGNPSSLHLMGLNAEIELSDARRIVAKSIGANDDEIFFTSGGTEANNIAIFGAAAARKKRGNRIVTTTIEHPSVLEPIKTLEAQGFEVIYLKPDKNGVVSESDIYNAINEKTILVSIMLVNNEVGSIQPIKVAADAIKKTGAPALLHCDAVQAFGKLNINVASLGVDLLSASGHKIHASKGVGFLYKKKNVHIANLIYGGGQEKGLRSGTEALPLISGLKGAIEEIGNINNNLSKITELRDYAINKLTQNENIVINSAKNSLPYILNISVVGYRSETLLHFLEACDIYVSSGSACAKGHKSYVLNEIGLDAKRIDSALRISFSRFSKKEDIDKLYQALHKACSILRKA